MKAKIFTFLFLLSASLLSAQITLDKRYEYSTSIIKMETLGYKYYLMDVTLGQCRLYNTDHSLFKSINCNIPSGYYLYDVKYISEKLFDSDAGLELLCTYYKYNSTKAYYEYGSKIINEDGSTILQIDGSLYNYINLINDKTYRLFSYCYDYSVSPEKVWTNIYILPGIPVVSQTFKANEPGASLDVFPNPVSDIINLSYQLPQNTDIGTLHIVDSNGRQVKQLKVDSHFDHLTLNAADFASGMYLYFIDCGFTRTETRKIIVK